MRMTIFFYRIALALFILSLSVVSALAASYTGDIFEKGTAKGSVVYRYEREEVQTPGEVRIITAYTEPAGKKVVEEETLLRAGKLSSYRLTHHQLNASGEVRIEGDQAFFTYTQKGKKKAGQEKIDETFLVGPTIVPFVQKNWDALMGGDEVKARYAVPDRAESVGFTYKKMGQGILEGKSVVMIRMKPTSPIIAALVDPLMFTFSPDGKELLELKGRTLPRKLVDGEWKDLDAEIVYRVESEKKK